MCSSSSSKEPTPLPAPAPIGDPNAAARSQAAVDAATRQAQMGSILSTTEPTGFGAELGGR